MDRHLRHNRFLSRDLGEAGAPFSRPLAIGAGLPALHIRAGFCIRTSHISCGRALARVLAPRKDRDDAARLLHVLVLSRFQPLLRPLFASGPGLVSELFVAAGLFRQHFSPVSSSPAFNRPSWAFSIVLWLGQLFSGPQPGVVGVLDRTLAWSALLQPTTGRRGRSRSYSGLVSSSPAYNRRSWAFSIVLRPGQFFSGWQPAVVGVLDRTSAWSVLLRPATGGRGRSRSHFGLVSSSSARNRPSWAFSIVLRPGQLFSGPQPAVVGVLDRTSAWSVLLRPEAARRQAIVPRRSAADRRIRDRTSHISCGPRWHASLPAHLQGT
jgi:hypothetical protein